MDSSGKKIFLDNKVLSAHNLEINSRTINISYNKNQKGEFVKLQENSIKSKITISSLLLAEIVEKLGELQECDKTLEEYDSKKFEETVKNNTENERNEIIHKSINLRSQQKRYYLDLKDTKYGRVLRISQVKDNNRSNITLNFEAIKHLMDVFNTYLKKEFLEQVSDDRVEQNFERSKSPQQNDSFNRTRDKKPKNNRRQGKEGAQSNDEKTDEENKASTYNDSRSLVSGNKKYTLECRSTQHGLLLKMIQNGRSNRPSVAFSSDSFGELKKMLDDMIDKANEYSKQALLNPK